MHVALHDWPHAPHHHGPRLQLALRHPPSTHTTGQGRTTMEVWHARAACSSVRALPSALRWPSDPFALLRPRSTWGSFVLRPWQTAGGSAVAVTGAATAKDDFGPLPRRPTLPPAPRRRADAAQAPSCLPPLACVTCRGLLLLRAAWPPPARSPHDTVSPPAAGVRTGRRGPTRAGGTARWFRQQACMPSSPCGKLLSVRPLSLCASGCCTAGHARHAYAGSVRGGGGHPKGCTAAPRPPNTARICFCPTPKH